MGFIACMAGMCSCSNGATPVPLIVLPTNKVLTSNMPAANISDNKPFVNITTFGMCNSKTNPMVIAIMASSFGATQVAPCVPVTPSPWSPGSSTVMIGNMPALNNSSKLNCIWGGSISFSNPGQQTVQVP